MTSNPLVPFDARKPNVARAYDYVLGGKDNFAADRELVAKMLEIFPLAGVLVRENRQFLTRAVDYVSRQGVRQFIEVGSGLPASPNTHEVASQVHPDARVAYVDNDRCKSSCVHAVKDVSAGSWRLLLTVIKNIGWSRVPRKAAPTGRPSPTQATQPLSGPGLDPGGLLTA